MPTPKTTPQSHRRPAQHPKQVTTWGVFPRPQNISQAYGGGRNIRPGQELETAEQKAKREVGSLFRRPQPWGAAADVDLFFTSVLLCSPPAPAPPTPEAPRRLG